AFLSNIQISFGILIHRAGDKVSCALTKG
ncbi:hypothetical protein A2U01_0061189, partial [Trifolium medium]|nr:hypothetical protein [Trifolium medium]